MPSLEMPQSPRIRSKVNWVQILVYTSDFSVFSISYQKLWFKVMQNLFWILQPCYINKQHHQGMMCVWIKGLLSAKSVKIVAIFFLNRGKNSNFKFPSILMEEFFIAILLGVCLSCLKQWFTKFPAVKYS